MKARDGVVTCAKAALVPKGLYYSISKIITKTESNKSGIPHFQVLLRNFPLDLRYCRSTFAILQVRVNKITVDQICEMSFVEQIIGNARK